MNTIFYEPQTGLNRFFDSDKFWNDDQWMDKFGSRNTHYPRVNIVEHDREIRLEAEVPGWKQDDIVLEIKDGILTLSNRKPETRESGETVPDNYRVREFARPEFRRTFRLGSQIDPDNVTANMAHGILSITFAKRQEAQPKRVEIQVDS